MKNARPIRSAALDRVTKKGKVLLAFLLYRRSQDKRRCFPSLERQGQLLPDERIARLRVLCRLWCAATECWPFGMDWPAAVAGCRVSVSGTEP